MNREDREHREAMDHIKSSPIFMILEIIKLLILLAIKKIRGVFK